MSSHAGIDIAVVDGLDVTVVVDQRVPFVVGQLAKLLQLQIPMNELWLNETEDSVCHLIAGHVDGKLEDAPSDDLWARGRGQRAAITEKSPGGGRQQIAETDGLCHLQHLTGVSHFVQVFQDRAQFFVINEWRLSRTNKSKDYWN